MKISKKGGVNWFLITLLLAVLVFALMVSPLGGTILNIGNIANKSTECRAFGFTGEKGVCKPLVTCGGDYVNIGCKGTDDNGNDLVCCFEEGGSGDGGIPSVPGNSYCYCRYEEDSIELFVMDDETSCKRSCSQEFYDDVYEGVKQKIKCDEVKCVNKAFFMKKTACTLIKRITSKQVTSNCYADLKKCDAAIDAEFTEQCPKTIFPHISDEPLATCHCAYATEPSSPCTASGKPWTIFKESGVQRTIEELDYCYDDGFDCLEALREQKCSRCKFDYASCI